MIAAERSHTALRVAMLRAAHQLLDQPVALDDPIAIPILGAETAAALRADPRKFAAGPLAPRLRASFAVRSRFAEDQLAACRARGVRQYVILGAGLDTLAYRVPAGPPLRVWEVDHPATQAWKGQLLGEAGIAIPSDLTYAPIDFERQTLPDVLAAAGFDPAAGAVFSWLGVVMYLSRAAVMTTLGYVASATAAGGGVAFDYALPPHLFSGPRRAAFDAIAAAVAAAGEPWVTFFEPAELVRELLALGFPVADDVPPEVVNRRYFANRTDGVQVGGLAHLMWAGTWPHA